MRQLSLAKQNDSPAPTDFASVFRAAPGLYLLLLPDAPKYTIITASDAYAKATLTKCEELAGRGIFDAFPDNPDDKNATGVANLRKSLEHVTAKLQAHEMEMQKYDVPRPAEMGGGFEEKYWSPLNTPVFDKNGEIQYIIHRVEDVTEKIRAEKERDHFFEVATDLMVKAGFDGYFKHVNPAWEKALGWTPEELKARPWTDFLHPDDVQKTIDAAKNAFTGKGLTGLENRYRCKSGGYRWLLWKTRTAMEEQVIYCAATDVTDIREAEQFAKSIIDSSTDCIKVLDLQGNLLSMNQGGCVQMEVDDLSFCISHPWPSFWQGREQQEASRALALAQQGETGRFEGFCSTMKGTPKWWEVIVTPISGADGKPIRILCVSRDITTRKKLETTALEAQETAESANMAKSEFLANMSHEIRTPMNAVIGLATILAKSEGLTPKQKDYIRTLQLSADSLLSLINDLLDISKIEARSIELEHIPFSITQMLNEVISMMSMRAKEKGLAFTAKGECNDNHILIGDPMRLRQIILNLCSNAIKFTESGSVSISMTCEPTDIKGVENISIAVTDTGIGIAPDKQDTIFQKFVQADSSINRKYGGTGLGLAITKTLAEVMGGKVMLKSAPGKGSTFTVTLPLMVGDNEGAIISRTAPQGQAQAKAAGPEHRVLLVEDYAANVLVAGSYLEAFGYSYDVVDNGYDAVEKAKTGRYIAVLMDVQMHGINGFEATKLIRAYEQKEGRPRITIIGMTAHALTGDRERCIAADMDDYLSKPYNPDELEKKLAACAKASVEPA